MNRNRLIPLLTGAAILLLLAVVIVRMCLQQLNHQTEKVAVSLSTSAPIRDISVAAQKNIRDAEVERVKELQALALNKPPMVYARVVDPSGRPIHNAKVVVQSAMGGPSGNDSLEETSDADGALSFAKKSPVLSIFVTKTGYQPLMASSATFQYAKTMFTPPVKPDPGNPVLFVLLRAEK